MIMRGCGKQNRPAPLTFNNFQDPFQGPLTCPSYVNHFTKAFQFDNDPLKSVPNSPRQSLPAPSIADLVQAVQTLSWFQQCQQVTGLNQLSASLPHLASNFSQSLPGFPQMPTGIPTFSTNLSQLHPSAIPPPPPGMLEVSRKVFIGGLPSDVDEENLRSVFEKFGPVQIDWPRSPHDPKIVSQTSGYAFLVYNQMESVQNLIISCEHKDGRLFYPFGMGKTQVRPWYVKDAIYIHKNEETIVDIRNTVFVGGVPRPATADQIANLLSEFGEVVFASIDVDPEHQYPKGAGRVIFAEHKSFLKAIICRFIKMDTVECHKKDIEIKPYVIPHQICDQCEQIMADLFCSDKMCLQYYCRGCFSEMHCHPSTMNHRVVIREGERTKEITGIRPLEQSELDNIHF